MEEDKKQFQLYEKLTYENNQLKLQIDTFKLNIEKAKLHIDKYYDQLKYIKENEISFLFKLVAVLQTQIHVVVCESRNN